MKQILAAILLIASCSLIAFGQTESRDDLLQQLEAKRSELAVLEKKFLAPSDDDLAAYAEFLKQPDTGLIRLLPREVFDQFPNKPGKLTLRGGGAYYSFARLTHEYGYGSDLELNSGYLSVGFAGADYGLMIAIGDVSLDEIPPTHAAAAFLAGYQPPTEESEARKEGRLYREHGRAVGGLTYQTRLPVQLNTTYLLRSIDYDDSDVFVAFHVVRKDTDGSVIIAWKLLKKYSKPQLTRSQVSN